MPVNQKLKFTVVTLMVQVLAFWMAPFVHSTKTIRCRHRISSLFFFKTVIHQELLADDVLELIQGDPLADSILWAFVVDEDFVIRHVVRFRGVNELSLVVLN